MKWSANFAWLCAVAGGLSLATAAQARCITTVGVEPSEITRLLVQAHQQKVTPRPDWDPDDSLFSDDGPYDGIGVYSYPVANQAAVDCQMRQLRMIQEIEEFIARKATAMKVDGGLDRAALVREVLAEHGTFEKDAPPPGDRIIVGVGIYCWEPSVATVDLTPLADEIVVALGESDTVQVAALGAVRDGAKIAC